MRAAGAHRAGQRRISEVARMTPAKRAEIREPCRAARPPGFRHSASKTRVTALTAHPGYVWCLRRHLGAVRFTLEADIASLPRYVRSVPKADIQIGPSTTSSAPHNGDELFVATYASRYELT
jgi:hypothetical protein